MVESNRDMTSDIRDSYISLNEAIFLFEAKDSGYVKYTEQMVYQGYHFQTAPDRQGKLRKVIVFELARKQD